MLQIDAALEQLRAESPRLADLVNLRFFAGLSIEDAAQALADFPGDRQARLGLRARLAATSASARRRAMSLDAQQTALRAPAWTPPRR